MESEGDTYIPTREAAALLRPYRGRKTHTSTIVRLALTGKVRAYRVGRGWFVHKGDLLALRVPVPRPDGVGMTTTERRERDAWTQSVLREFNLA